MRTADIDLAAKSTADAGERESSEERLELMAREVDHRAKNVLAVVQAVARLTRGNDVDAFRKASSAASMRCRAPTARWPTAVGPGPTCNSWSTRSWSRSPPEARAASRRAVRS